MIREVPTLIAVVDFGTAAADRRAALAQLDGGPVTGIAFGVGYTSLSAFDAAFQELTGRTPAEYRVSFRPDRILHAGSPTWRPLPEDFS